MRKRIVRGSEGGDGVSVKMQFADVKKVLRSVHKMNLGGNGVVLDGNKSYMQNKETGRKIRIEFGGGQPMMYLWVPSDCKAKCEEENKALKGNNFAILATEKEEARKDFTRRV